MKKCYFFVQNEDFQKLSPAQQYLYTFDRAQQYTTMMRVPLQGEAYERGGGLGGLTGGTGNILCRLRENTKFMSTMLVQTLPTSKTPRKEIAKIIFDFKGKFPKLFLECDDSIEKPLLDEILKSITPKNYNLSDKLPA